MERKEEAKKATVNKVLKFYQDHKHANTKTQNKEVPSKARDLEGSAHGLLQGERRYSFFL